MVIDRHTDRSVIIFTFVKKFHDWRHVHRLVRVVGLSRIKDSFVSVRVSRVINIDCHLFRLFFRLAAASFMSVALF